jgi:SAM-dependent methyltransferase
MQQTLAEIGLRFDTDKSRSAGYLENYELHFGHLREKPIRLLELGVYHGGSLLMWHKYFSKGLVVGLDLQPNPLKEMPDRVRFYQGSQSDGTLLDLVARECAPDGFDIVIDDAAHIGTLARASFRILFEKHLKPGGIYVIEDWGTGYWESWPDGAAYRPAREDDPTWLMRPSSRFARLARRLGSIAGSRSSASFDPSFAVHNFGMVGMVGMVKELIDEAAWKDITFPERGNSDLPAGHR